MIKAGRVLFFLTFLFPPIPDLHAHDFWIERQGKDFMVVYGHGDKREEFDPSKIKEIKAFDLHRAGLDVVKEKRKDGLFLKISGQPSLIFVEIDDGYWSKTIYGWKNLPKRKARRVRESIRSFYYSKAMISWSEVAQGPGIPMKLDMIPLRNPFEMKAGDHLSLKVLYEGRPLPGIEAEGANHQRIATTDQDGIAKVQLSKGYQVITVKHKEPIKDDPDAEYLSITSTIAFEVKQ